MSVYELFRTLYRAGVVVLPAEAGGIDAEGPLTESLRDLIRDNKEALRAELDRQKIGERSEYPSPVVRTYVVPDRCPVREACHRLGPCGPPGTVTSCTHAHDRYAQNGEDQ